MSNSHPEIDPELKPLVDWVVSQEVVDVWCNGCQAFRKMNAAYAQYLPNKGEIDSCSKCQ